MNINPAHDILCDSIQRLRSINEKFTEAYFTGIELPRKRKSSIANEFKAIAEYLLGLSEEFKKGTSK